MSILNQKKSQREVWIRQLADVITDPQELMQLLKINTINFSKEIKARNFFSLRVPRTFAARMRPGDLHDPLLRQVLIDPQELCHPPGFSTDPLKENYAIIVPGLLHKYFNRVLLLVKGDCAIHCRYCFRRHFPYQEHAGNKKTWQGAIDYISMNASLDEVIFSGGDPLMAKDEELNWLITKLEQIPHIQRIRIHTRLPIVIPARITNRLCDLLNNRQLQFIVVTHINHANEINAEVHDSMVRLRQSNVFLFNQSVLLKGVNDSVQALLSLSKALFSVGISPLYLHLLDRVAGSAHFLVEQPKAKALVRALMECTSGYLVPKLVRDDIGMLSKTLINMH